MKYILLTVVGLMLGSGAVMAAQPKEKATSLTASEPIKCYQLVWGSKDTPGLGLTAGQAVTLCSGTDDAAKTAICFVQAWSHPNEGGLGLTAGQAVSLCKSNSLQ